MAWFKGLSLLWRLVLLAAAVIALVLAFNFVRDLFVGDLETKAKLGTEQADAAIESGQDAVDTVGKVQGAEDDLDTKAKGIEDEVDKAGSVDDAHRAGSDGLCQHFGICD